jgi:hypothetical protein
MTLFEQAVIDAKTVREEAMRYGETKILEQFAPRIEEAVNAILEKDLMDGLEEEEEVALPEEPAEAPEDGDVLGGLPMAALDGEAACPCPGDDELIDIELDDLFPTEPGSEEDTAEEIADELDGLKEAAEELNEEETKCDEGDDKDDDEDDDDDDVQLLMDIHDDDDDVELVGLEEALVELAEKLRVDITRPLAKTGWDGVPTEVKDDEEDLKITQLLDDEERAEYLNTQAAKAELEKEVEELKEALKSLKEAVELRNNKIDKMGEIAKLQQEKLNSLSEINMRLFYVNEVLKSESLNGQQKKTIVEKLERTKNPGEAKLVFESLQGTVGVSNGKRPKSLREVAANVPQNFVARSLVENKSKAQDSGNGVSHRWQKLAGIKK